MRLIEHPRLRTGFLVLLLVTLLAGDAWRYTIGWAGFTVLVAVLAAASIALLVVQRRSWSIGGLPYPLIVFLALTALSTLWSFYPAATALGTLSTWLTATAAVSVAVTYSWAELLRGLSHALRLILALSLLFEFVVAAIIRRPVLPPIPQPGIDYASLPDPIPKMLFWSRDELFQVFDGGKIQGIVGNSTLLSFVALLGLIVFAVQWAGGDVRRRSSILWLVVAGGCLLFTRSATIIIALVVVAAVVAAVLLLRRAATPRARSITYAVLAAVLVLGGGIALLARSTIFSMLGKSSDLTNRGEIWEAVIQLAQQRPVQGWGWVSYWVPWVEPFTDLAENNGVRQLHAHNAWLDVWFQLGIIGLIVVAALVLSTLVRAWQLATDRPQSSPGSPGPYTAATLMPLLVIVALLVQSVAESRLLVEYGMFLLVLLAVKTKTSAELTGR